MDNVELLPEDHRILGVELFNKTWGLMDKTDRTPTDDATMLDFAHASSYHWSFCGTVVNQQRGYWLISRVYAVLGIPDACLLFAKLCRECTETGLSEMEDFDIAFSFEALARAYALNGELKKTAEMFRSAVEAGNLIKDEEDQEIFVESLHSGVLTQIEKLLEN
jgi:hypothetical protein